MWKGEEVETKYRQFFRGVLPQRKAKIWSSGLAQKVGTKGVLVFNKMRELTAYLNDDNGPETEIYNRKERRQEFPGRPMIRTWRFHCSLVRKLRSHKPPEAKINFKHCP